MRQSVFHIKKEVEGQSEGEMMGRCKELTLHEVLI